MASATAGVAAGALVADSLTNSNGRIAADYTSGSGGGGKKKGHGGGRHVATPAGSARYHLPIGAPLGHGKAQQAGAQASYDTFMACTSKSDMSRNAKNMSNADLTKSADAVFSVKTDNARNQAAQDVLVQELAARGIDPHKYGYTGGPVVVSPNPKADPTVTAHNKVVAAQTKAQKAADAAAKAQQAKVAKDAAAAAKAQQAQQAQAAHDAAAAAKAKTAADKAAAQQAAQAKAQQAQVAAQQAAQAQAAQIEAARNAAAESLINGTESAAKLNAQWQQLMGTTPAGQKKLTPVAPQTMAQAKSNPGMAASGLTAGVWNKLRHPRDAHGRFIQVGDIVHGGGVTGKVEGMGDKKGTVKVREASGALKQVEGKSVQKLASGHGDAVKGLDHATKGLVDHTAGLLGKEKKASELKPGEAFHHPDGSGVHVTRSVLKPEHTGGTHTSVMSTGPDGKTGTKDLPGNPPVKVHEGPLPAGHGAAPKPAAPEAPKAPAAPSKPAEPPAGWNPNYEAGGPDFLPKEGHQLAQGDLMHAYGKDGSKKTLKVDGVARNATGHTVTATDTKTGQQHTVAVPHGAQVPMAGPHQPVPPLDEKALAEHVKAVESQVDAAVKAGLSTDAQFSLDGKGQVWAPERAKLHNEIVQDLYAKAAHVPNEGKGLFSGGLGGAGKTTTLGNPKTGIDQSQFLTINPDDIKEILAERGMVPDIPGEVKLSPMEKVALIHEESSHIANLLAQLAYADKKNVTWDITMASEGSVAKRIAEMKKNGYTNLDAIFVDIPVEGSVTRAMARYQRGMEAYRNGKGMGGRYVPPSVIRKNASTSFSSANRKNFEALRDQFDNWQVWDNSVDKRDPRLVYSKTSPDLPALTAEAEKGLTDADRQKQGVSP